jgi:hypothetical protein
VVSVMPSLKPVLGIHGADPDPSPDPTPFVSDLKDAKRIFFHIFFLYRNLPAGTFISLKNLIFCSGSVLKNPIF